MRALNGETHHVMRYDKVAYAGALLEPGPDTDDEDLDIIRNIYVRNNYNFDSVLKFFETTDTPVEEVANAIDGI
jgi:hypothetical protein